MIDVENADQLLVVDGGALAMEDRRSGKHRMNGRATPTHFVAGLPRRTSEASLVDTDSVGLSMTAGEEDRLRNSFTPSPLVPFDIMGTQQSDESMGRSGGDGLMNHAENMGGTGGSNDAMEDESTNKVGGYQGDGASENGSPFGSVIDYATITKGRFKEIKNLLIMLPTKTNLGLGARKVGFHVANHREFDLYRSYLTIHCGNTYELDDNSRTIYFGDEMFLVALQIARCAYAHANGLECLCGEELIKFMFDKCVFCDKA